MSKQQRQLPVLDVEQGIARLMGNRKIYFSALNRFNVHVEAARTVAAQWAAGDRAGASRTIHTLKGAAGLLCAGEVQAIAGDLEAALAHEGAVDELLEELAAALQRLQARIDAAVPDAGEACAPFVPPPVIGNVQELLDRLDALLDEGNALAIDLLDQYGVVLERALNAAAWETIVAAVRDYDFDRALLALQDARSTAAR